jgi:hypothetical protein
MNWLKWIAQLLPQVITMPDLSTQKQDVLDKMNALDETYQTLVRENSEKTDTDKNYNDAVVARNNASVDFQAANTAFLASPADDAALAAFETAIEAFKTTSRAVLNTKKAKDTEDGEDSVAQSDYNAKRGAAIDSWSTYLASASEGVSFPT